MHNRIQDPRIYKVLLVCHVHIICAPVSEKCDTHQVEQIDADNLVLIHLHLCNITILISFRCLLKTPLEILPQPTKMCMSIIRVSRMVLSFNHIIPQQLQHQINNIRHVE